MKKVHLKIGNLSLVSVLFVLFYTVNVSAQRPVVSFSISEKKPTVNEQVTFTVTTNISGTVKIDFPTEFNVDNGLVQGMEQKYDASTGKQKTFYYIQQTGSFSKEGNFSIYAYVKDGRTNFKSNKLSVNVQAESEEDNSTAINSKDPIFGIIQLKKNVVYEGEPILIKAKVFSLVDIYMLEGYSPFKADKNAEEFVFQNQNYELERARYNGKNVLTFEYGKQLLFPVGTGKCRIQPFEMSLRCRGGFFDKLVTFKSNAASIQIKPLPDGAPSSFIGAVGTFDLAQEIITKSIKQGEIVTFNLTVSGTGNLQNTNPPKLKLPKGCTIYGEPELTKDLNYTEDGVTGSMTYRYNIQIDEKGKIKFPSPCISYFNPETEEYVTVKTASFEINVKENPNFQPLVNNNNNNNQSLAQRKNLQVVNRPDETVFEETNEGGIFNLILAIITPVLLIGFLLFIFLKTKKRNYKKAKDKIVLKPFNSSLNEEIKKASNCAKNSDEKGNLWKETEDALADHNRFAIVLPKAILNELEQKLYCNESFLFDREMAFSLLAQEQKEVAEELKEIIAQCDQYRYGFGGIQLETNWMLHRSKSLLDAIRCTKA